MLLSSWLPLFASFALCVFAAPQSPSQSANSSSSVSASSSPSVSLSTFITQSTSFTTVATTLRSGNQNIPLSTAIPIVLNVTATSTITLSAPTNTTTASPSPTPDPLRLDTKIDPAFGVLGALLILTGLPSAFLGHKNRWSSFFLIGFYTLSLVCLVLILKFGVLQAVNPPTDTVRGLFVLACGVAGIAGGGVAIFFWKASKYFIGAWGGFAFALWVQCFRNGGLISPIGFRWIMYIGVSVVGFVLCTISSLHYYTVLVSTAFVGATSFILGVDCYTTGNLKEFYIWNIGFGALFPRYTEKGIAFPVSQTIQIELGLIAAVALMGIAVQFRILKVLQRKLREIKEEQRRQDEAAVAAAAERFASLDHEKDEWEAEHPGLPKHGRSHSAATTLLNTPDIGYDEKRDSPFSPRQRYQSGVSEFLASPTPDEELLRAARQTPGVLPAMDLGLDIERNVPRSFMAAESSDSEARKRTTSLSINELEELKKKQELLAEIQTIRRSIDVLRGETPAPSTSDESRRPSLTSKRTLSQDLISYPAASNHLRPPRQPDPRARSVSMDLSRAVDGASIGRPNSTPLRDDWDSYVRDRKVLQPPSGITSPIPTTPISNPVAKVGVSPAVTDALALRQRRESSLSAGYMSPQVGEVPSSTPIEASNSKETGSDSDVPILPRATSPPDAAQSTLPHGQTSHVPTTILPPRRVVSPGPKKPEPTRTRTFEELAERHREKMKEMQAPLTRAEKEQAQLLEAKNRWERANYNEKVAVAKRQAEQMAALSKEAKKKRRSSSGLDFLRGGGGSSPSSPTSPTSDDERKQLTLNAEALAAIPDGTKSTKRMSTMKVDNWQKHQLQEVPAAAVKPGRSSTQAQHDRQGSSSRRRSVVPFPEGTGNVNGGRDSLGRRLSGMPRDPPN